MKKTRQLDGSNAVAVGVEPTALSRAMRPELVNKSRQLTRVLRHRPELWGVRVDREGWCQVDDVLSGMAKKGQDLTADELREIVDTNDKRRFTLSRDGLRIPAVANVASRQRSMARSCAQAGKSLQRANLRWTLPLWSSVPALLDRRTLMPISRDATYGRWPTATYSSCAGASAKIRYESASVNAPGPVTS